MGSKDDEAIMTDTEIREKIEEACSGSNSQTFESTQRGSNFKLGAWSASETNLLVRAIEIFAEVRGLDIKNPTWMKRAGYGKSQPEVRHLWSAMNMILPHRKHRSIMEKAQSCFLASQNIYPRKKWSEEEDEMLCRAVDQNGLKWTMICELFDRSSRACRDRYREIVNRGSLNKGKWSDDEVARLVKAVQEVRAYIFLNC